MLLFRSTTLVAVATCTFLIGARAYTAKASPVAGATASDSTTTKNTSPTDRLKLSGTFQGELRWNNGTPIRPSGKRATSDLYVRIIEIALESPLAENVSSTVVLNSEWLDDFVNEGDQRVAIDEAHIDVQGFASGPYAVFGKRSQPFGVFENQLISDPMAKDAYEVNKVGLTAGIQAGPTLDASLTVYKGAESSDHLFQSRLFDTAEIMRAPDTAAQISSWVASGIFSSVDSSVTLMAAVLSEPGHVRRNVVVQLATNIVVPMAKSISFDAEYIKALRRERYVDADREFRESVLSLTAAYSFVYRPSQFTRRGLYRARRLFARSHPFTTAFRFESFQDDGMASYFSARVTRGRYSLGGRYTVVEKAGTVAYVAMELNRTTYRTPVGANRTGSDHSDTFLTRLGVDF